MDLNNLTETWFPEHDEGWYPEFVILYHAEDYFLRFAVRHVIGADTDLKTLYYGEWSGSHSKDPRDTVIEEAPLIHGSVKWDGCMDCSFGGGEDYTTHFCGLESAMEVERALRAIYALAAEKIPEFDPEIAK